MQWLVLSCQWPAKTDLDCRLKIADYKFQNPVYLKSATCNLNLWCPIANCRVKKLGPCNQQSKIHNQQFQISATVNRQSQISLTVAMLSGKLNAPFGPRVLCSNKMPSLTNALPSRP